MCPHSAVKIVILPIIFALLLGCGAMDTFFPAAGTYKVNVFADNLVLENLSFIKSGTVIRPYFENTVSDDPDVTTLMIYLKNSNGETVGYRYVYTIDDKYYSKKLTGDFNIDSIDSTGVNESKDASPDKDSVKEESSNDEKNILDSNESQQNENILIDNNPVNNNTANNSTANKPIDNDLIEGDNSIDNYLTADTLPKNVKRHIFNKEYIYIVESLDHELPRLPISPDLPIGKYTLIMQVMSNEKVLYKSEKKFFYLANAVFSLDAILVNQPGITSSAQLVTRNSFIMLEADLNFDSHLDPYIVWYSGKKIIGEGSFSNKAGNLLWKAPDHTGFVTIRAEVFPVKERVGMAGFIKEIDLLVSSKKQELHFVPDDAPDLIHWYVFEGDLNDSIAKTKTTGVRELYHIGSNENENIWIPENGTYGLVSSNVNSYQLPKMRFSGTQKNIWEILCRFMPLNDGVVFSVQFVNASGAAITLTREKENFVLTLSSSNESVSKAVEYSINDSFLAIKVIFKLVIQDENQDVNQDENQNDYDSGKIYKILTGIEIIDKYNIAVYPEQFQLSLDVDPSYYEFLITLGSLAENKVKDNASNLLPADLLRANSTDVTSTFITLWDEFAVFLTEEQAADNAESSDGSNYEESGNSSPIIDNKLTGASIKNERNVIKETRIGSPAKSVNKEEEKLLQVLPYSNEKV